MGEEGGGKGGRGCCSLTGRRGRRNEARRVWGTGKGKKGGGKGMGEEVYRRSEGLIKKGERERWEGVEKSYGKS